MVKRLGLWLMCALFIIGGGALVVKDVIIDRHNEDLVFYLLRIEDIALGAFILLGLFYLFVVENLHEKERAKNNSF